MSSVRDSVLVALSASRGYWSKRRCRRGRVTGHGGGTGGGTAAAPRGARFGASLLSAALVLTACSDDGIAPIEDPPDASGEPTAPDPPTEEPEEPEDTEPEIFQGQLYPPLPDDLEADPRGGDEDIQREILDVHEEVYLLIEEGFSTNAFDEASFVELTEQSYAELVLAEYEAQVENGRVSISPDASLEWIRVSVFEVDEAIVLQCSEFGPLSGGYDADTGEPVNLAGESTTLLRTFTYRQDDDGWKVSGFDSQRIEEVCDELPQA